MNRKFVALIVRFDYGQGSSGSTDQRKDIILHMERHGLLLRNLYDFTMLDLPIEYGFTETASEAIWTSKKVLFSEGHENGVATINTSIGNGVVHTHPGNIPYPSPADFRQLYRKKEYGGISSLTGLTVFPGLKILSERNIFRDFLYHETMHPFESLQCFLKSPSEDNVTRYFQWFWQFEMPRSHRVLEWSVLFDQYPDDQNVYDVVRDQCHHFFPGYRPEVVSPPYSDAATLHNRRYLRGK